MENLLKQNKQLKYVDVLIGFSEIPDEISLCINISNCCNNCEGCHSSYLKDDIGVPLTEVSLSNLIDNNKGISCVCLMGGDVSPDEILFLIRFIKTKYPELKTAWYSGKTELPTCISLNLHNFDYIKLGPYIESLGPLTSPKTNQKIYKINFPEIIDITSKFWK